MRLSHAKLIAAAGLVGGLLVLAGCGGSSGPSKAQFVAKADAICKTTQAQITPLVNQIAAAGAQLLTGSASATRQVATVVQHLHTVAAASLAKLRALAQPSADHKAIQKFLTPLASIVDSMSKAASALSEGQGPQALALLQTAQPLAQQVTGAAKDYGLVQCQSILSALG
jgi:hypothetical protein